MVGTVQRNFEFVEGRNGTRRETVAADLVATVSTLFQNNHAGTTTGSTDRRRRPGRAATNHGDVEALTHASDSIWRGRVLLGDPLMMMYDFSHDETQKLLGEDRVEARLFGECPQSSDLFGFTFHVSSRKADRRLVTADILRDLESFSQQMDQRRVDVVDAGSKPVELFIGHDGRDDILPNSPFMSRTTPACRVHRDLNGYFRCMSLSSLPLLFVDHLFPDLYRDLVDGRAELCGLGTDDRLDVADAVIAGATRTWDAETFALAPNLTVISRVGVGYDNVNVPDAAASGVIVCNAPLAPMVSTAEHTMALLFAVTKVLPHQIDRAKSGLKGEPIGLALELDGSVLGLVGFGRIASRVAVAAQTLGMRVVAADPFVTESPVADVELVALEALLSQADVISLHAPAMPETVRMIDAAALARMKPGAYLINCARGVLVDHEALLAAIDSGHLGGAGLDVTDPEPLPAGHPLLDRINVVVTPHIASATVAGRRRLYEHSIENALAVLEGRPASIVPWPSA